MEAEAEAEAEAETEAQTITSPLSTLSTPKAASQENPSARSIYIPTLNSLKVSKFSFVEIYILEASCIFCWVFDEMPQ